MSSKRFKSSRMSWSFTTVPKSFYGFLSLKPSRVSSGWPCLRLALNMLQTACLSRKPVSSPLISNLPRGSVVNIVLSFSAESTSYTRDILISYTPSFYIYPLTILIIAPLTRPKLTNVLLSSLIS